MRTLSTSRARPAPRSLGRHSSTAATSLTTRCCHATTATTHPLTCRLTFASIVSIDKRVLGFLEDLNTYLDMPANADQLDFARKLSQTYLIGTVPDIEVPKEALAVVTSQLETDAVPPRDLFAPVLSVVLASLQVNAYRLFSQSSHFQPLLDLKAREVAVPAVTDFKLLQVRAGPGCCRCPCRACCCRCPCRACCSSLPFAATPGNSAPGRHLPLRSTYLPLPPPLPDPRRGLRGQGPAGAQKGLRRVLRPQGARQEDPRLALAEVDAALVFMCSAAPTLD